MKVWMLLFGATCVIAHASAAKPGNKGMKKALPVPKFLKKMLPMPKYLKDMHLAPKVAKIAANITNLTPPGWKEDALEAMGQTRSLGFYKKYFTKDPLPDLARQSPEKTTERYVLLVALAGAYHRDQARPREWQAIIQWLEGQRFSFYNAFRLTNHYKQYRDRVDMTLDSLGLNKKDRMRAWNAEKKAELIEELATDTVSLARGQEAQTITAKHFQDAKLPDTWALGGITDTALKSMSSDDSTLILKVKNLIQALHAVGGRRSRAAERAKRAEELVERVISDFSKKQPKEETIKHGKTGESEAHVGARLAVRSGDRIVDSSKLAAQPGKKAAKR